MKEFLKVFFLRDLTIDGLSLFWIYVHKLLFKKTILSQITFLLNIIPQLCNIFNIIL